MSSSSLIVISARIFLCDRIELLVGYLLPLSDKNGLVCQV